jgi:bacillithiol system protein YtxJ
MNWKPLTDIAQLDILVGESRVKPIVIFKHSTRCSISDIAKSRLDRAKEPDGLDFYYLDLIQYRPISNEIAERFKVHHESPQIIILHEGECIYDQSHNGITMDDILAQVTLN